MSYRELFEATLRGPWKTTGLDVQYRVVRSGKHAELYLQGKAVGHPDILTISGYSHGGALAILAHEDFTFHGLSFVTGYAFGAPRVVWMPSKTVASRFSMLTRVRMRGDLVTKLPPWMTGYRHVGSDKPFGAWQPPNPWAHKSRHYVGEL